MSEEKKKRSLQEVEQEYAALCQRLGHITYQIDAYTIDCNQLKSALKDLNLEAFAIKNAEAKAAEEAKLSQAVEVPTEVAGA